MTKKERREKRRQEIEARRQRRSDVIFKRFVTSLFLKAQLGKVKVVLG